MKSFEELHKELLPTLERIERSRWLYLFFKYACLVPIQLVLLFFVAFIAAAVFAHNALNHFMIHQGGDNSGYFIVALMVLPTLAAFPYAILHWKMVRLHTELIEKLGNEMLPNFEYSRHTHINAKEIAQSRIFPSAKKTGAHAVTAGKGSLKGTIGETSLTISDISFSSAGRGKIIGALMYIPLLNLFTISYLYLRPWFTKKTVEDMSEFRGLFARADFNKKLRGHTILIPDILERALGFLAQSIQSLDFTRDQLVPFEDPEFEREFAVFSTDPIEARYALSPTLVHQLVALKKKWRRPVMLSFHDTKLSIAVRDSRGFFDLRLGSNVTKPSALRRVYDNISFCAEIVDDLNLNRRIWGV